MEHLALYRKWRPQNFHSLVGQGENALILKNAVSQNRQAHAYLFCGTRGTGKTSTARILAKALNCLAPENGEPCNECRSCRDITDGRSLNVFEIDAASNRGIDEVRELLENVRFVPAEGGFKVYIIDEAHMLTTEAFNALLKTFEEPPAHVVFILATTEPRKIPLTILSRCQRYDFKPIGEEEMAAALKVIAQAEELDITDDALDFLAQKAKGSMRDALSLMDQGMGAGEKTLTVESLSRILGSVLTDFWPGFIKAIAQRDIALLFNSLDDLAQEGKDLRTLFSDLRELLGDIISYKGDTSKGYGRVVLSCRGLLSQDDIITILTVIGEGEKDFRFQRDPKVVCRFLLAKALREISCHREQQPASIGKTDSKAGKTAASSPGDPAPKMNIEEAPAAAEEKAAPALAGVQPRPRTPAIDEVEELWSEILAAVKRISSKTYTWLSRAQFKEISDKEVVASYYDADAVFRDKMLEPAHQEAAAQAIKEVLGKDLV
ncbi:MAG: DNA polymerase III subunit gamma/tau, partial [Bacillota bacterium]|nr:DNA polymerase III subunit gamma/tau [Bacillota bacterium]